MAGRLEAERGQLPWDTGGTYAPPVPGPDGRVTLPPGWGTPPHIEAGAPEPGNEFMLPVPEFLPGEKPPQTKEEYDQQFPPADRMTAREFLDARGRMLTAEDLKEAVVAVMPPSERVNLIDGTASFMGHDLTLSSDGIESIKTILAMEVCLKLETERERILNAVQLSGLPATPGSEGSDVPEVQGTEAALEPAPPSGEVL